VCRGAKRVYTFSTDRGINMLKRRTFLSLALFQCLFFLYVGESPGAQTLGAHAAGLRPVSQAESFEGVALHEPLANLRGRYGDPPLVLYDNRGTYWVYRVDQNRAWLVIYASRGLVESVQILSQATKTSTLSDPSGVELGDREDRLFAIKGRPAQAAAPFSPARYSSGANTSWFYGVSFKGRIERIGLSTGNDVLPAYVKYWQHSGLDPSRPVLLRATGSALAQEDAFLKKLPCGGNNFWQRIAGRSASSGTLSSEAVKVRCGNTSYVQTYYFTAKTPIEPSINLPSRSGSPQSRPQGMNQTQAALPPGDPPAAVWVKYVDPIARASGRRLFGSNSQFAASWQYTYDSSNPPSGFDIVDSLGDIIAHNCAFQLQQPNSEKCSFTYLPFPQGQICITILEHTAHGDNYSPIVCFYISPNNSPFGLPQPTQCHTCTSGPGGASAGHPIDLVTGALWYRYQDLALSGPFGLQFNRWYDSLHGTFQASLGVGWRSNYDAYLDLSLLVKGEVVFNDGEAHATYFYPVTTGQPSFDQLEGKTLTENSNGTFTMTTWSNETFSFDNAGRLTSMSDRIGNTQTIARDSSHRITSVTDGLGRQLQFAYDAQNRMHTIVSVPAGASLTFAYDSGTNCFTGDLCTVTESDGQSWKYQYYAASGYGGNHMLEYVIDPNGNIEEYNKYSLLAIDYSGQSSPVSGYYVTHQEVANQQNKFDVVYNATNTVVTDGLGRSTSYFFDNTLLAVTLISGPACNCNGDSLYYYYDMFGRLTATSDATGTQKNNTYNYGRDVIFTSPDGATSYPTTAYPSVTDEYDYFAPPNGSSRHLQFAYYALGTPIQDLPNTLQGPSVDTVGNTVVSTLTFNNQGLLTALQRAGYVSGVATAYSVSASYDSRGRLLTYVGPRTDVAQRTALAYYPDTDSDLARRGQLQSMTDALNHVTNVASAPAPYNTYDIYGNARSVVDPNAVVTDFDYDARGRVLKNTLKGVTGDPADLVTTYTYDNAGRPTQIKRPLSNGLQIAYDAANRQTGIVGFDSSANQREQIALAYDAMSQLSSESAQSCPLPASLCSSWSTTQAENYTYNASSNPGNLATITYPAPSQATTTFAYAATGLPQTIQQSDPAYGVSWAFAFDAQHRLTDQHTTSIETAYALDAQDNVNAVTQARTAVTTMARDDFGRVRSQSSPVSGLTNYSYDPAGNVLSSTDANGAVTTRTYDALDRPLSAQSIRSGRPTETVSWTYDNATSGAFGIGRLASMTDPSGQTTYTYERRGLLASQTQTVGSANYPTTYTYDGNGNRATMKYPSGRTVTYGYDFADRAYSASAGATVYVSSISYMPFGPKTKMVFGNGVTQTIPYDQRYRPSENKLVNASSQTLSDLVYSEDAVSNITGITDQLNSGYNDAFTYNLFGNQISTMSSGSSLWGSGGVSTDGFWNVTNLYYPSYHGAALRIALAYTNSFLLTQVTTNNVPQSVTLDAAGNELMVGSSSYVYSARNLLSSGDGVTYVYDGFGRRVTATASQGTRTSLYDPDLHLMSESSLTGTAMAYDYIWLGGIPVAQEDSNGTHWTQTNQIGAPTILTNSSGAVIWQADYEPFGHVFQLRTADMHQPIRYPGQEAEEFDPNGGPNGATPRFYNGFRWYRPAWGRYTQSDPIGLAGGFNPYNYAGNNPMGLLDPMGLNVGDWWDPRSYATLPSELNPFNNGGTLRQELIALFTGSYLGNPLQLTVQYGSSDDAFNLYVGYYGERASLGIAGAAAGGAITLDMLGLGGAAAVPAAGQRLSPGAQTVVQCNLVRFDWTRAAHIFRNVPGHFNLQTASARAAIANLFENVASDASNLRTNFPLDPQAVAQGVVAYTKIIPGGQIWVLVRGGAIVNAGLNLPGHFR
jgi:RHS repeat-associated protein